MDGNIKAIPIVAYYDFRGSRFTDINSGDDGVSTDAKLLF
jgi:hypothetical protein